MRVSALITEAVAVRDGMDCSPVSRHEPEHRPGLPDPEIRSRQRCISGMQGGSWRRCRHRIRGCDVDECHPSDIQPDHCRDRPRRWSRTPYRTAGRAAQRAMGD